MRGIRLALDYLRIGILNEFQYRANLYIQILLAKHARRAFGTRTFANTVQLWLDICLSQKK